MRQEAPAQQLKEEETRTGSRTWKGLNTFSSLAYRDFRFLWLSVLFTSAGQWIEQVSVSWLVYEMTDSALMLGLVNGLRAVPFLVSGPLGGVAADRMDRKKLMMGTQVIVMTTCLFMGLLVVTGLVEVWHIFGFTLLNGIAWSFNQPVRQAVLPNVVPSSALLNAIALNAVAFNITRVVGPALAGVLISLVGAGGNFFIQGFAYFGVMMMIWLMKVPEYSGDAKSSSVVSNLVEGLRYVWEHEIVLMLMLMALIPIAIAMPYTSLMPIFAKDVLAIGPEGLGMLMAAPGVGAVVGMLMLASIGDFRRKGAMLIASAMAMGVFLVLFGVSSWLPLSLLFLAGVGVTTMAYMTTNNTTLQLLIPDALRGRVMSIYMLDQGLMPLGSLMAGALAGFAGAPAAIQVMGALVFLLGVVVLLTAPQMRRLE